MKKQIFIIHGGMTFRTDKEYMHFLRTAELDFERFRSAKDNWKDTMSKKLGRTFEVILPVMPSKMNAKYADWKIWFNKFVPHMRKGVVLVGHSLGAIFLVKYLSETKLSKKIRATILVAAPFDDKGLQESLGDFKLPKKLERFQRQAGKLYVYHSADDAVVPFDNAKKYMKAFPKATVRTFKDRGHFNQETFPELVKEIKGIYH